MFICSKYFYKNYISSILFDYHIMYMLMIKAVSLQISQFRKGARAQRILTK